MLECNRDQKDLIIDCLRAAAGVKHVGIRNALRRPVDVCSLNP